MKLYLSADDLFAIADYCSGKLAEDAVKCCGGCVDSWHHRASVLREASKAVRSGKKLLVVGRVELGDAARAATRRVVSETAFKDGEIYYPEPEMMGLEILSILKS